MSDKIFTETTATVKAIKDDSVDIVFSGDIDFNLPLSLFEGIKVSEGSNIRYMIMDNSEGVKYQKVSLL